MVGQVLCQNYSYRTMVLNLLSFTPIPRRKALLNLSFTEKNEKLWNKALSDRVELWGGGHKALY